MSDVTGHDYEVVGVPAGSRTPSPRTRASELVSRFLGGAGAEPAVSRLAAAGRSSDPTEVDQQAPLHCMSCASARSKRGFEMLSRAGSNWYWFFFLMEYN